MERELLRLLAKAVEEMLHRENYRLREALRNGVSGRQDLEDAIEENVSLVNKISTTVRELR